MKKKKRSFLIYNSQKAAAVVTVKFIWPGFLFFFCPWMTIKLLPLNSCMGLHVQALWMPTLGETTRQLLDVPFGGDPF